MIVSHDMASTFFFLSQALTFIHKLSQLSDQSFEVERSYLCCGYTY